MPGTLISPLGSHEASATIILGAASLPAAARGQLEIDLSALLFNDVVDAADNPITASFATLFMPVVGCPLGGTLSTIEGVRVHVDCREHFAASQDTTNTPTGIARWRIVRRLFLFIENTTNAPVSFSGAAITLFGIAAANIPAGYSYQEPAALINAPGPFSVARNDSVTLPAVWMAYANQTRSVLQLADHYIHIPAVDANYSLGVDFSAAGLYGDVCYHAQMTSDEPKVIITEQQNQKTTGHCYWTIYVPSDATPGGYGSHYGSALYLKLSATLAGWGWVPSGTGGGAEPISGAWDALTPML